MTGERRFKDRPLVQLTLARLRELVREPGALFWTFGFPVLIAIALGLAFRNRTPGPTPVGVLPGPGAAAITSTLAAGGMAPRVLDAEQARRELRAGRIDLVVLPPADAGTGAVTYRFDPARTEARAARAAADQLLQRAAGRTDARVVRDEPVNEPGARYIDFFIPGLLGFNLMSGSLWGIGWAIVSMRTRKLLKRMVATPMRRRDLLLSMALARLVVLPFELLTLLAFAYLAFGVHVAGSLALLVGFAAAGVLSFAGIALLVSSRAENSETVSGLINLVIMPMALLSGVFFSSAHFPDAMQPFIKLLPLTALNDALRGIMIDAAPLSALAGPAAVLAAWGAVTFVVALRIFRWT